MKNLLAVISFSALVWGMGSITDVQAQASAVDCPSPVWSVSAVSQPAPFHRLVVSIFRPSSDVTEFRLKGAVSGGVPMSKNIALVGPAGTYTYYVFEELLPSSYYEIKARSICADGSRSNWARAGISTPPSLPD